MANKRAKSTEGEMESDLQKLCNQLLQKHHSIRFVGIASRLGRLNASAYRSRLVPLMTRSETEQYAIEAVTRALTRETFESKVGKLRYAIGTYEKLVRATIPVHVGQDRDFYLLLSFDIGSNTIDIIEKEVLPCVKDTFLSKYGF